MIMQIAALQTGETSGPDIHAALRYGIISLKPNEEFDAESPLTRRDFALYLSRVFHLPEEGRRQYRPQDLCTGETADDEEAYAAIHKFVGHGILDLDANGNFNPKREITLGEMARAAYRLRGLNPHGY
jgi:hypothetical protein